MSELNIKEMAKIMKKFSGKNEEDRTNSLVMLETMSINPKTSEQSTLAVYASALSINNAKIIDKKAMLDINFVDGQSEDCLALIDNMDLYTMLLTQDTEAIINKITLVLNDELNSEQLCFINPMYYNKSSDRAGRRINGMRLLYDIRNVVYIPEFLEFETDEDIRKMAEQEGRLEELEGLYEEYEEN